MNIMIDHKGAKSPLFSNQLKCEYFDLSTSANMSRKCSNVSNVIIVMLLQLIWLIVYIWFSSLFNQFEAVYVIKLNIYKNDV